MNIPVIGELERSSRLEHQLRHWGLDSHDEDKRSQLVVPERGKNHSSSWSQAESATKAEHQSESSRLFKLLMTKKRKQTVRSETDGHGLVFQKAGSALGLDFNHF